jgi:hypothetical protein
MRDYHNVNGVFGLMLHAVNKSNAHGFASLQGDLNQMSIQAEALRAHGFEIGFSDVYPIVKTEDDFKRALRLLWDHEVPGWWHYKEKMTQYGICTEESWKEKLENYCERAKSARSP